jgi:hypothetical protein
MSVDDADLIAHLEIENLQLRHVLDDERRHISALRENTRELGEELTRVRSRNETLEKENARLSTGRLRILWPLVSAVGVILGTRLVISRRHAVVRP